MKNNFLIFGFTFILIAGACKTAKKQFADSEEQVPPIETLSLEDDKVVKILFGSCNKEDQLQPLWKDLNQEKGDIFLWLGDNIYGDSEDPEVLKRKYNMVNENAGYSRFKNNIDINGTWDDHDYGVNDGGKEFPAKAASQQLLLDFLDIPKDHPRRDRQGVYDKISMTKNGIDVDIFILDTRYFRDPIVGIKGKFKGDSKGTILGKAQWNWLDEELGNSNADIHIFLSSIQLIAEEHGWEKWANFPEQKQRFLDLVTSHNINFPIILSGDRHSAEISEQYYQGYTFYDITSSSLNRGRANKPEANKFRVAGSEMVFKPNYGILEISKDENFKIKATIKTSFDNSDIEEELFTEVRK